jgi:putative DNA primase/helicase
VLRYVAAALTIVRAYIVAGKPDRLRPLPSYGPWSDLVRNSLVWLGRADPMATMEETRVEDPRQEARIAIFEAWKSEIGLGQKYQTSELIGLARAGHRARTAQRGRHHREGLKVCGLSAGGSRIRTIGSA